jgi:hypothetical protein
MFFNQNIDNFSRLLYKLYENAFANSNGKQFQEIIDRFTVMHTLHCTVCTAFWINYSFKS